MYVIHPLHQSEGGVPFLQAIRCVFACHTSVDIVGVEPISFSSTGCSLSLAIPLFFFAESIIMLGAVGGHLLPRSALEARHRLDPDTTTAGGGPEGGLWFYELQGE